jgi:peptidyl-prolyl cis-trans isomerase-like 3
MIQGGDPTGTGKGGQSIWGRPFNDEIRQTLKVSHVLLVDLRGSG